MLIAIIGENCVGKSTLAKELTSHFPSKIFVGKDFLRLERNPSVAKQTFKNMLAQSVCGENLIFVISEKEHIDLLPEGALRILLTADLDVIKERFRDRMRGVLPPPVEKMLERNHGAFDSVKCDFRLESGKYDINSVLESLNLLNKFK
jgi:deoxyadenosine/deoxycytidine kinase